MRLRRSDKQRAAARAGGGNDVLKDWLVTLPSFPRPVTLRPSSQIADDLRGRDVAIPAVSALEVSVRRVRRLCRDGRWRAKNSIHTRL